MSNNYKLITDRVVIRVDGVLYTNVSLIDDDYRCSRDNSIYVSDSIKSELDYIQPTFSGQVKQGSSIFLANNIPIDVNVLRKCYQIKRKPEDADYIVCGPLGASSGRNRYYVRRARFYPDKKLLVNIGMINIDKFIQENDVSTYGEAIDLGSIILYMIPDTKDMYIPILTGNVAKPIVGYKQLDLSSGDAITYETLKLTYKLGCESYEKDTSETNFILNLKALNNYNWRKYRHTLCILFRYIKKSSSPILHYVEANLKRYPKTIQDIITNCTGVYKSQSQEDFDLAREFLMNEMNIRNLPMFVSATDLLRKSLDIGLGISEFEDLFSVVAKISDKEYVEQKSED